MWRVFTNWKICKMSGKVSRNIENITKILLENFEETENKFCKIHWSKKIDNAEEILKVTKSLYQWIMGEFAINFGEINGNFCQNFQWILWE